MRTMGYVTSWVAVSGAASLRRAHHARDGRSLVPGKDEVTALYEMRRGPDTSENLAAKQPETVEQLLRLMPEP